MSNELGWPYLMAEAYHDYKATGKNNDERCPEDWETHLDVFFGMREGYPTKRLKVEYRKWFTRLDEDIQNGTFVFALPDGCQTNRDDEEETY